MRRAFPVLLVVSVILFGGFVTALWSQGTEGSLVIVFQDGHRQSFRLADISRIEFNRPSPTAAAKTPIGRSRFVGHWRVGEGGDSKSTFKIALKADGTAHKSNTGGDGTWTLINGAAEISWDDGWHDVIRKEGGKFRKEAYNPGKSLSEEPTNSAFAEYLEPQ